MSPAPELAGAVDLGVTYQPDHLAIMAARLPTVLRRPRIMALLAGWAAGVQEVEDTLFNLLDQTTLDAAGGVHLRQWAQIVGQAPGALSDQQLRRFIRVRLRVSRLYRHGVEAPIDGALAVLRDCTDALEVRYFGLHPAGYNLTFYRDAWLSDEEVNATVRLLLDAIPAGVQFSLTEALPGSTTSGGSWGGTTLARRLYP